MGNRVRGVYDTGAEAAGYHEADIVMAWANCLRDILIKVGHTVVRTRVNEKDPAPVSRRDDIATAYGCSLMISLHCNAANGSAKGTETFYRGEDDKAFAVTLNKAVVKALGTVDRGAKTEKETQHPSLAVMEFNKCWLIELGFIDNSSDRAKLVDPTRRYDACLAIAAALTSY